MYRTTVATNWRCLAENGRLTNYANPSCDVRHTGFSSSPQVHSLRRVEEWTLAALSGPCEFLS